MYYFDHVNTIDRALNGNSVSHDTAVINSWRRCVDQHGLDPAKPPIPHVVSTSRLKEHQERLERLAGLARNTLEGVFDKSFREDCLVLITDKSGVAVNQFGKFSMEDSHQDSGLALGVDWSEKRMGTSGIGSVLETRSSLVIHQRDHFSLSHLNLTCIAAPIFDTLGELSAVLNVSRAHAPPAKIGQDFALNLLKASVKRIELANLEATANDVWVLRFSMLPELVRIHPDAAITIDKMGHIVGATHNAIQILSKSKGADWRAGSDVIGNCLNNFFEMELDELPKLARTQLSSERSLRLRNGAVVYCHITECFPKPKLRKTSQMSSPIEKALGVGDAQIEPLIRRSERFAQKSVPLLITGETGAGKEVLARAIHKVYGADKPFVAVNCASLSGEQLDVDLFGSREKVSHAGLLGASAGGILFLDEICDLSLDAQARLLRVLNDGYIRPVGGGASYKVDFRLISSTQKDIGRLVSKREFRKDLYFRIASAILDIPPLRARTDAVEIAQRYLRRITISRPESWRITRAASAEILRRRWHGNFRELFNAIEVATILADTPVIDAEDLPTSACDIDYSSSDTNTDLRALLEACDWNLSRAARRLGVDRSTIYRRMKSEGIKRD